MNAPVSIASPIVVVLRGEPQGKGRPRSRIATGRGGQQFVTVYTPKATRAYESALALAGKVAMRGRPPLEAPLEVSILAVMGIPQSWSRKKRDAALAGVVRPTVAPDWDNIAKGACDGLNGVVFLDDKQVVRAVVEKRYGEEPLIKIEIKMIGGLRCRSLRSRPSRNRTLRRPRC